MKTTEDILREEGYDKHDILDWEDINNVMKIYSNQKIYEASEIACNQLELYNSEYEKLSNSILSLKDKI